MFPRDQRLTQSKLYSQIFRRGTWHRGRLFSLVIIPATTQGRIGFLITKKIAKSSVLRNRTKRRVRSVFMQFSHDPAYTSLFNRHLIIVVLHQLVTDTPVAEIVNEAKRVLDKLAKSHDTNAHH